MNCRLSVRQAFLDYGFDAEEAGQDGFLEIMLTPGRTGGETVFQEESFE